MVSTRRSRAEKKSYTVGDKVEILREGEVDIGILLKRKGASTPGSSSSTTKRWLVSVSGSLEDEDISEINLGRIIAQNAKSKARKSTSSSSGITTAGNTGNTGSTGGIRSSRNARIDVRNAVNADNKPSPRPSVSSLVSTVQKPKVFGKSTTVKVASSVPKSKALVGKKVKIATKAKQAAIAKPAKKQRITTRASTRSHGNQAELYSGIETEPRKATPPRPKLKSKQSTEHETVIEVKMLTGTLYIYRGDRPRAEFIRVV